MNNIGTRERQHFCPGSPRCVGTTVSFAPDKNLAIAILERQSVLLAYFFVSACGAAVSQKRVEIVNTSDVDNIMQLLFEHLLTDLTNA